MIIEKERIIMNITEELISSLAPNSGAITNAKKISKSGGFVSLYKSADNTLIFGECSGSGKSLYKTSVDFSDEASPVSRCSCPSRQFPCKHGLAIMYDYLAGKTFTEAEVPEDVAEKRKKKESAAAAKKTREESGTKPKPNKAAAVKKMKKQLEGLDLVDKFVNEVTGRGISAVLASSYTEYAELAKLLGDYYLTEPQRLLNRIVKIIRNRSNDKEKECEKILECLIRLRSISKKGRTFLEEKTEAGELPAENDPLLEAIGFTWQLSQLRELGLCKQDQEIIQLSFEVDYDPDNKEMTDIGWWMDLETGEVSVTENHRPLKAAKYIKEDDTAFDVYMVPELCMYPGEVNRRIRWEKALSRPVSASDIEKVKKHASDDITALIKTVKNYLKNPLSRDSMTVVFKYDSAAVSDGKIYIVCGDTYLEAEGISAEKMPFIAAEKYMTAQFDIRDGKIIITPLSVISDSMIIRMRY